MQRKRRCAERADRVVALCRREARDVTTALAFDRLLKLGGAARGPAGERVAGGLVSRRARGETQRALHVEVAGLEQRVALPDAFDLKLERHVAARVVAIRGEITAQVAPLDERRLL